MAQGLEAGQRWARADVSVEKEGGSRVHALTNIIFEFLSQVRTGLVTLERAFRYS